MNAVGPDPDPSVTEWTRSTYITNQSIQ